MPSLLKAPQMSVMRPAFVQVPIRQENVLQALSRTAISKKVIKAFIHLGTPVQAFI